MVKVLLSEKINEQAYQLLVDKGYEVKVSSSTDIEVMKEEIKDADALILRSSPLPDSVIREAKNLKIISRHGTGINNIDLESATKHKVLVAKVNGANSYSVAEYHMTQMLALSRKIYKSDQYFKSGKMSSQDQSLIGLANKFDLNGSEIRNKKLAILGYGAIGRILARLAKAFEMEVKAYDPFVKEADVEVVTDKDELLAWSDFVSICMPLTPQTENFLSSREFALMKDTAIVINAGRGGIVNEEDLAKALEDSSIAGAALDVFTEEPPSADNPILKAPNIILTSHIAGTTFEASKALSFGSVQNIIDYFEGKIPESAVNKEVVDN